LLLKNPVSIPQVQRDHIARCKPYVASSGGSGNFQYMREIIFDTETTGLDSASDRIIEIGAVELENRFVTGRSFHKFINPDGREVHPEALAVHGISNEQLADKPKFQEILQDWLDFVEGATLIAHNASFDVGFFNAEFARIGFPPIDPDRVVDSLSLARRRHPMGPNSLDALCKRYGIDNSMREKHGALLDSELLAEVYIELVGGKQAALGLEPAGRQSVSSDSGNNADGAAGTIRPRAKPLPSRLTAEEAAAHLAMVQTLGDDAMWIAGVKKGG
jgi:DNA polymerase-3 subunit epsilon